LDDRISVYEVTLLDRAYRDLDGIYNYIANTLMEPDVALGIVDNIEAAILSLDVMPYRCPERKIGLFAGQGYRQLLIGNYTALYRVDEERKLVVVVTIRYSPGQF